MKGYASWGNYPRADHREVVCPVTGASIAEALHRSRSLLPRGLGRSQGDSCLNEGGVLLDTQRLNHFLAFDEIQGLVRAEAGVTLADILVLAVPRGWFLPVTPGTKYVTLGGAIANDVHGKNHHAAGSFGHHIRRFELVRSSGERLICSAEENSDLFYATIGGLGLTGVIVWADLQLRPITSQFIEEKIIPLSSLDDFFAAAATGDQQYEYTVAWIDCLARGKKLGRGLLLLGNHVVDSHGERPGVVRHHDVHPWIRLPIDGPPFLISPVTVRLFNEAWYRRGKLRAAPHRVHFNPFFYPLDGVGEWNRAYGKRGFFQYQCVVPRREGAAVIRELLSRIAHSQLASFLATMKYFGDQPPAGLLSFPRGGITLAVDFANYGQATLDLFQQLDEVVMRAGGALYPAKDARMSRDVFGASFPRWREFEHYVDPVLSSSFWRRIHP